MAIRQLETDKAKYADRYNANLFQIWLDGPQDLLNVWGLQPNPGDVHQWQNQRDAIKDPRFIRSFYGATEQEARAAIINGTPELAKTVEELAKKVATELPPPASRRRVRKWREDGDELNLDRIRLGYDACWRSMHRKLKNAAGLVEVVQAWGGGCGASLDQLKWSGASALALVSLLESADYSCELALVAAMGRGTDASLLRVDLKRMGEFLNLESLTAVAVYPPAWRIYGLCAFQQAPYSSGSSFNGHPHGSPFTFTETGMWNYRPNVMTLTLNECYDSASAHTGVLDALKHLESLVNPQEVQE